jgi:peptide/nickel transport system substrate-binding protein
MRTTTRGFVGLLAAALATTGLGGLVAAPSGAASGPKHGGSLTYAVEAETPGGFCTYGNAQLAPGGIEEVNALYDTLTTLNSKGQFVPYLAKSVTPNADFTQWTITLRPGITFHDGEPLDANAVKLNIDTARGQNPNVGAPLSTFVDQDIAGVTVTGPLTLVVQMKTPWPTYPAYLYGSGRAGIAAPAQLQSTGVCPTKLIGTGPFQLVEWVPNEHMIVKRNPHYWRPGLPYLDQITFVPVNDAASELNGLTGGSFDVIQTSSANNINAMRSEKGSGSIQEYDTARGADVGYGLYNDAKPPFNDMTARLAVAYAGDAVQLNQIRNKGIEPLATGPFGPGTPYYLTLAQARAAGLPYHNLAKAKALVKQWSDAHGGQQLTYNYLTVTDPELLALAELVKQQDAAAGINVTITQVDQATLINDVLAGSFQEASFRNQPQDDPDTQYVWWHSGSPVNFSKFSDPQIDSDLEQGRVTTDPARRVALYRDMNKRFAAQVYEAWAWYTLWAVGYQKNVGGIQGVPLPDGQGTPFTLFEGVVPTVGLYKS